MFRSSRLARELDQGSPDVVNKEAPSTRERGKGDVVTGTAASAKADYPIKTGDPVVDEWEREELEDDGEPLRFIDGPATATPSGISSALAEYTRKE